MKGFFLVFLGGGLGSALRYYFSLMQNAYTIKWIPTITVNLLGCLLLGVFIAAFHKESLAQHWYVLLGVGLCGGLTTFSTFSAELFMLLKSGAYVNAVLYFFLSTILGICLVAASYLLTSRVLA
jgi:CrcB protein